MVRRAFRHPPAGSSREEQLDRAFASLRLLAEQVHMQECSSSCTSEGVHVEVGWGAVGGTRGEGTGWGGDPIGHGVAVPTTSPLARAVLCGCGPAGDDCVPGQPS